MNISKVTTDKDRVFNFNSLKIGKIHFATIQSLAVIAIATIYYCNQNIYQSVFAISPMAEIILSIVTPIIGYAIFMAAANSQPKPWHLMLLISAVVFLVFTHNGGVNAQILDDVQGAIDDVGTAAGGNIAADILEAVIQIIRIAVYIAVAGAVIASIIFGVTQGQWQAPVLVVGVIIAVGLFLELMGVAVFG